MARRRNKSSRGVRHGPKNNVWTSVVQNEVLVATGNSTVTSIVTAADWSNEPLGERATILTARGWLSICGQNDVLTKSEGQVFWYIGIIDALVATGAIPPADLAATYTQTSILASGGHVFESVSAVIPFTTRNTKGWEINLKTMRTIRSGEDLILVVTNGTGDDIRVGSMVRALLRKGGN